MRRLTDPETSSCLLQITYTTASKEAMSATEIRLARGWGWGVAVAGTNIPYHLAPGNVYQ